MWGGPGSLRVSRWLPDPQGRGSRANLQGSQGHEGPVAFITKERLDGHKSISLSGKTAPRTCLTLPTTLSRAVGQPGPLRGCLSSAKFQ